MPTEYWLQKKAFNSWSHVTWYSNEAEAKVNLDRVAYEGNGYSWRMVRVDVIEQKLNEGERECLPPEPEPILKPTGEFKSDWGTPQASGWGKLAIKAAPVTEVIKSEHGSVGLIWLGNPATKEKRRVPADIASTMLNEGWVKAGPRTVL